MVHAAAVKADYRDVYAFVRTALRQRGLNGRRRGDGRATRVLEEFASSCLGHESVLLSMTGPWRSRRAPRGKRAAAASF